MAKKILQIIETAYRATVEEQDDTAVWLTHAMVGAGAQAAVLLRGNAVNYLVPGQESPPVVIGAWRQTHPPALLEDIVKLSEKGVPLFYVSEDLEDRGLDSQQMAASATPVRRNELAAFLSDYDHVWHW